MSEFNFININERAYKYIRQFSIKTVDDALVELITNCNDAYKKTSFVEKVIEIDIINPNIIKVRDRAIGLTAEQLGKCFLQIGNYTASDTSRGFFSRGAKDISAIGDITFNSIKNGKYSQCILNTDAYGLVTISDIDATLEIRNDLKIPDPFNGLEVTINLLPNFRDNSPETLYNTVSKLAVLRDIMGDPTTLIWLRLYDKTSGEPKYNKRLTYVVNDSSLLLDVTFSIPNYVDKKARFVVYKVSKPFPQPVKETMMEFGFLIKDSTSVYEVGTISDRFRWNPYINYLYGHVYCDHIHELLVDYDRNGASSTNPYPIIDPSRLTGINKQHPFIIQMLAIPSVRLDYILRELNKSISHESISLEEIDDLLDELTKYGVDIIEREDVKVSFVPSYDEDLLKAIEFERSQFVSHEKSYVMNNQYDTEQVEIDKYVYDKILRIEAELDGRFSYVLDDNNNLVQIEGYNPDDPYNTIDNPANILKLIPSDVLDAVKKRPYIYRLDPNGTLSKLYIFDRGSFKDYDPQYESATIKSKQFNIQFINDLNIPDRYIIDTDTGITVKINMNNPIVKKYLVDNEINTKDMLRKCRQAANPKDINDTDTTFLNGVLSINHMSSTISLTFMKELMNQIITDIVLQNDIKNGKLVLDSVDSYNNCKKVMDYRSKLMSKFEMSLDLLFNKIIIANADKKKQNMNNIVNQISDAVSMGLDPSLLGSATLLKSILLGMIDVSVE